MVDWGFAIGLAIGGIGGFLSGAWIMFAAWAREVERGWTVCNGVLYTTKKATIA